MSAAPSADYPIPPAEDALRDLIIRTSCETDVLADLLEVKALCPEQDPLRDAVHFDIEQLRQLHGHLRAAEDALNGSFAAIRAGGVR